jgi:Arc/MetJ family transcription regulator
MGEVAGRAKAVILLRVGWDDDAVLAELMRALGLSADEAAAELQAARRLIGVLDLARRSVRDPAE